MEDIVWIRVKVAGDGKPNDRVRISDAGGRLGTKLCGIELFERKDTHEDYSWDK